MVADLQGPAMQDEGLPCTIDVLAVIVFAIPALH